MKQCKVCGSTENIKIIDMHNIDTNEKTPLCHVCFNQAAHCIDDLVFMGEKIHISLPRADFKIE